MLTEGIQIGFPAQKTELGPSPVMAGGHRKTFPPMGNFMPPGVGLASFPKYQGSMSVKGGAGRGYGIKLLISGPIVQRIHHQYDIGGR